MTNIEDDYDTIDNELDEFYKSYRTGVGYGIVKIFGYLYTFVSGLLIKKNNKKLTLS